jgi:2-dehydropantoate 2-reductase
MTAEMPKLQKILVVGCGAIGSVVAASLIEHGADVTVLTTNQAIAEALVQHGFRVTGEAAPLPVRGGTIRTALGNDDGPFDWVLLTTQPPQVEQAAKAALPWLAPTGQVVCFQNGLCEERLAPLAGRDRVVGAVVAWGASTLEPGVVDRTSSGGFTLGYLDAPADARLDELGRLLESVGPVTSTDNLRGARFSKLAINCAISTLGTIGGDRVGALMRHRFVRRLTLEIMTEAVRIARHEGIFLEKVSGTIDLDWIALTDGERVAAGSPSLLAKHALLLAVGARYRRLRSSMLAAIERGRPPAVDFLNGEIVARGVRHGVAVPVNRAATDWVWQIARGERRPGLDGLRALYESTR